MFLNIYSTWSDERTIYLAITYNCTFVELVKEICNAIDHNKQLIFGLLDQVFFQRIYHLPHLQNRMLVLRIEASTFLCIDPAIDVEHAYNVTKLLYKNLKK